MQQGALNWFDQLYTCQTQTPQGRTMGLSTHVLDTMHGCPAAAMAVSLYNTEGSQSHLIRSWVLNADGRSDGPLLDNQQLKVGTYRLVFGVIDFGVSDATQHYHVPLLVSPWSYATYRGS
jgi:5-hydroxyisourate hydrolase